MVLFIMLVAWFFVQHFLVFTGTKVQLSEQALLCIKLWGVCYNLVHNQTNASSGKMDEKLLQSLKLEKILCINEISCNYRQDKVTS